MFSQSIRSFGSIFFSFSTEFIFKQSRHARRYAAGMPGNRFQGDNWQNCRGADDAMTPVRSFYNPSGLVLADCESNAVCLVVAKEEAAYGESVLRCFALSLTAPHSY